MAEAMPKPRFVFIDEIAQVLQFLAAQGNCRMRNASAAGVFPWLVQIVRDAEVVLVADAGLDARSIAFLEHCRPGERFQVIEM
jgi:putative DNA primase/helicase